ncbi:B-cell receptor CD22-like [Triplophysa rosa]|uniref:B-cell receptor CD22-like n=1 Tax=Triplophysa rosa TaxID=992332 RepID=UPI002545EB5E|nr:B-cell receptor CD22-like [Triplophysa rosa]
MFALCCLITLLVNPGMCSHEWAVHYLNKMKCALKGSTTILFGSFTYPDDLTLTEIFWTVNPVREVETPDLSKEAEYKGRVKYIRSDDQTFFLKLCNATSEDEKMYCIRIVTDEETGKYLGYPGIELKVTELNVEVPEEVIEGNSAVLFCKTTCNFADSTKYSWYKNKIPLSESFSRKELFLRPVSSDDAGEYSCALREHKDLPSPAVTLNVRYPPKNTSASISSSGVIVEGDSVTLTCSSESNPPVHIYSWFKENQTSSVGSGQTFSITNINSRLSGGFYCVAQNKHGSQRSAAVSLTVKGVQSSAVVSGIVAGCGGLFFIIIFIILFIKKRRTDSRAEYVNQTHVTNTHLHLHLQ